MKPITIHIESKNYTEEKIKRIVNTMTEFDYYLTFTGPNLEENTYTLIFAYEKGQDR